MGYSEYRGLIVMVTFVTVILAFVSLMAQESHILFTSAGDTPEINQSSPMSMIAWNSTNFAQINYTNHAVRENIAGWRDLEFDIRFSPDGSIAYMEVQKYDTGWFGIGQFALEDFRWMNQTSNKELSIRAMVHVLEQYSSGNGWGVDEEHTVIPFSYLNSWYQQDRNNSRSLTFYMDSSIGGFTMTINFDAMTYETPQQAAQYGSLWISVAQDWSDRRTSLNILSVISGLFFGQIFGQNTLGLDPTISVIISITLLTATAYIVFQVVRSLIPLLPGD